MTVTVAGKRRIVARNASPTDMGAIGLEPNDAVFVGAGVEASPTRALVDMISSRVSLGIELLHLQILSMQIYQLGERECLNRSNVPDCKGFRVVISA
jgi:hypothetical protein